MKLRSILIFSLLAAFAHGDDAFQQGLAAYENSEYEVASRAFETAIATTGTGAAHHNLALALFQQGQHGEAAWHLERARLLKPGDEGYAFKLEALRQQLGLEDPAPAWHAAASQALSQRGWIILLSVCFWFTVAACCLPYAGGYRSNLPINAIRAVSLIGLLTASTALYLNRGLSQQGIVLSEAPATLHAAPAAAAPKVGLARPGERGQKIDQHGDYRQIKTEGGARGWINAAEYRLLLPAPK